MFNTVLPYRFVQRNRNQTGGRESWLSESIYKFFIHSFDSRRKYLVEVRQYPDHFYTVDFYAKIKSAFRYRLRTNQHAAGKLGATALAIIADTVRSDQKACFGFIAAAMLDETSDTSTRRFQLYTKMLELKIDPTRYKVEALSVNSSIFVVPAALAAQPGALLQLIDRYDRIFRETF